MERLSPNQGKELIIIVSGTEYARYPVKTAVIKKDDDLSAVIKQYTGPYLRTGDIIFVSEKIVAISQGRSFPIKDIKPSRLATWLSKKVHQSPYGIGLGSPWTMQLALNEAGYLRIMLAIIAYALTRPFGIRGAFYIVAGRTIAAIDGPCDYTLPPYNEYAKLGPKKPHEVARQLKQAIGHEVIIIDANDLGVNILGKSDKSLPDKLLAAIFKDNPLGQTNEQTPIAIVRRV